MEEKKEDPVLEESSEQPELQQGSSQIEDVREDRQQSVESQSPPKTPGSMSQLHPVLQGMLASPKKSSVQQTYVCLDDRPSTSKQAQQSIPFDKSLQQSSSSQGEKRRSEGLLEHSQAKQFRIPDELKEEKKEKEEHGEKDDKEGTEELK